MEMETACQTQCSKNYQAGFCSKPAGTCSYICNCVGHTCTSNGDDSCFDTCMSAATQRCSQLPPWEEAGCVALWLGICYYICTFKN